MKPNINEIDEFLLNLLVQKGWEYLREDILEWYLKKKGIDLEAWQYVTRTFYLAGRIKLYGKEFRIWKPVMDPQLLLQLQE
ncbi:MAG TPA: hypothetical protein EYH22_03525 [Candidatus Nanopusillus sp.]|nr:hypothetical protein [Candidatus Nanopusillus sp.]